MRKRTARLYLFLVFTVIAVLNGFNISIAGENPFSTTKSKPLNAEVKLLEDPSSKDAPYLRYHVWYDSENGVRVPGLLTIPKQTDKNKKMGPPWPVIFFMHYHESTKELFTPVTPKYAENGFAAFAIDGVYKGERAVKDKDKDILDPDPETSLANMKQQIFDILRGFDFLSTQKELDIKRLGYFGVSMGAFTGAVATANDERVKTVVLALAGGDLVTFFKESTYGDVKKIEEEIIKKGLDEAKLKALMEKMKAVDPLEYAGKFKGRPVLMLNGKKDTIVPKVCAEALYNALPADSKKIIWSHLGHLITPDDIAATSLAWFKYFLSGEEQKKEGDK